MDCTHYSCHIPGCIVELQFRERKDGNACRRHDQGIAAMSVKVDSNDRPFHPVVVKVSAVRGLIEIFELVQRANLNEGLRVFGSGHISTNVELIR